jgi:hypothetical protein
LTQDLDAWSGILAAAFKDNDTARIGLFQKPWKNHAEFCEVSRYRGTFSTEQKSCSTREPLIRSVI